MSGVASKVYLISRRELKADAVEQLKAKQNVTVQTGSMILGFHGGMELKSVDVALRSKPENSQQL
jgi:thioredoxin reductase